MTNSPDSAFPSHPVDPVLSRYYRSQVPSPFPACRALDTGPKPIPPARRPNSGTRARAILAIAALVLLAIGILLSSGFPGAQPANPKGSPGVLQGSTAEGSNLLPPPKKPGPMGDTDRQLN